MCLNTMIDGCYLSSGYINKWCSLAKSIIAQFRKTRIYIGIIMLPQELEYFRGQHRAAMNQLEVSAQEASSLRGKYSDLLNDNQR